jgi:hypothetical protein
VDIALWVQPKPVEWVARTLLTRKWGTTFEKVGIDMFPEKRHGNSALGSPLEKPRKPLSKANAGAEMKRPHRLHPLMWVAIFGLACASLITVGVSQGNDALVGLRQEQDATFALALLAGLGSFGFLTIWIAKAAGTSSSPVLRTLEKVRLFLANESPGVDKKPPC